MYPGWSLIAVAGGEKEKKKEKKKKEREKRKEKRKNTWELKATYSSSSTSLSPSPLIHIHTLPTYLHSNHEFNTPLFSYVPVRIYNLTSRKLSISRNPADKQNRGRKKKKEKKGKIKHTLGGGSTLYYRYTE